MTTLKVIFLLFLGVGLASSGHILHRTWKAWRGPAFNHTAHRELWDWLARNPDKDKAEWPGFAEYGVVLNNCFACSHVLQKYLEDCVPSLECHACPLEFSVECSGHQSLFSKYCRASDPAEKSRLAAAIRDVPVKPGVRCR